MLEHVLKSLKEAMEDLRLKPGSTPVDYRPEEIRENRLRLGLTIQELADEVGVTLETMEDLESGKRKPGFLVSIRLTKIFGHDRGGGGRRTPKDRNPQDSPKSGALI